MTPQETIEAAHAAVNAVLERTDHDLQSGRGVSSGGDLRADAVDALRLLAVAEGLSLAQAVLDDLTLAREVLEVVAAATGTESALPAKTWDTVVRIAQVATGRAVASFA
jgi:hypothetical protein